ncbi:hypothetical protein B9T62_15805 [Paenibacillus donghaensis]|uniref:Uncharacterized protein n=1 Tax=Paenibacillus donghaensis TaxID=414771 RepID=A0A2Z2K9G5_9BACL|nr:hypothetical protein B9T62_15805 [Paenibacillus donghaensis]
MVEDKECLHLAHFLFPGRALHKDEKKMLLSAIAARQLCRIEFVDAGDVQDLCLQVYEDRTLVTCMNTSGCPSYTLDKSEEVVRAFAYLFNCSPLAEEEMLSSPSLLMSRSVYEKLRHHSGSCALPQLAASLSAATGDQEQSFSLARVMKHCSETGELRLCSRTPGGWEMQYASYIGHHSNGWLLRMSCKASEDWMIAVPISRGQLFAALEEWIVHAVVPSSE